MSKEVRKHTKHTALLKPSGGKYHRNEWSIIGAPCDIISKLAAQICASFPKYKIGILDADHNAAEIQDDYYLKYTDRISVQEVRFDKAPQQKQYRKYFNDLDLLLVNGNHFVGDKQIVIINPKKKDSLERKFERLSDVRLVLLDEGQEEVHASVNAIIDDAALVLKIDEIDKIVDYIQKDMVKNSTPLNGLVFAGGKSVRMGRDKGAIDYKGKPHRLYTADMLSPFCDQVYMSCRSEQKDLENNYPKLIDTFTGLGPYSGILSAFRAKPNHAWLTIACDLPLLEKDHIRNLIENRNPSKLATCYYNPDSKFPEPLISIWEPRAYPVLLEFLSQGYSCPRKVLINSDIEMIKVDDVDFMLNVNDEEVYKRAISKLTN